MEQNSKKVNQEISELEKCTELLIYEFRDWRLGQLAEKIKLEGCKPKFKTINF